MVEFGWITFALMAAFFWGASNVVDKQVMVKYVKNPIVGIFVHGIVGVIFALIVVTIFSLQVNSWYSLAGFLGGVIYPLGVLIYFRVLKKESVAAFITMTQTVPIFVLLFSVVFLKDSISSFQFIGMMLLIAGAMIISMKKENKKKLFLSTLIVFALVTSVLYAGSQIFDKISVSGINFLSAFVFTRLGAFSVIMPVSLFARKDIVKIMRRTRRLSFMIFSEVLAMIGSIFFFASVSIGKIPLVSALTATQPFFVILLSLFFVRYTKALKIEIEKQNLIKLLLVAPLLVAGVYLISG